MHLKFESKSQRVKGLSFHPIRPWILASLHNGTIQLWDYKIQSLVETFDAHEGPCRGINFHSTQPLFVSGGDDYLIKVWNYKQRKHLFTLKGHLDYVRTTEFHKELPWILSSSDDQTIRIWNYQSRSLLAILTGHSHYVMCAAFHQTKDLIVSCSLDQTLRLWDFSAIKNKYNSNKSSQQKEVYGTEVEIVAVMEGHDLGVNWCAFHPELNMIISSADDRKVKLWKYTETKAWEHDSFFGHTSNVSSCVFQPKLDMVVSNAEDKTTRVWSLDRRTQLDSVKRETDRYWIISAHPENYLIASGHDSGFQIYNLIQQKLPFSQIDQNQLVYGYQKELKAYDFRSQRSTVVKKFENSDNSDEGLQDSIQSVVSNPFDTQKLQVIVGVGHKERYQNRFSLLMYDSYNVQNSRESVKGFYGLDAIFVSKSKIARLKDTNEVDIYNVELDSSSNALPGLQGIEKIFQSPVGKLLALNDEALVLYDVNTRKVLHSIQNTNELNGLKQVVWNKSHSYLALVCKKNIHIYSKNMVKMCTFPEKFNVKSLIWGKDNTTVIYSTINHIKFGLLNGDSGILKCTDSTLRVVKMEKNDVFVINSNCDIVSHKVNTEELALKSALQAKNWEQTQKIMKNMNQIGNSVVSYLYKKNYPGLALNLVNDKKAQFSLALDSGNLDVAFAACNELKEKDLYKQFAKEALRQGQVMPWENNPSVEMAYRQTKQYEKLMFLYLITGQTQKLSAMTQIAQKRGDNQSRFQNALYTGDVQERVKILSEIGQIQLAYLTAVSHGLTDMADILKNSIDNPEELLKELEGLKQTALVPPQPLVRKIKSSVQAQRNWPLNHIPEEYMIVRKSSNDKADEMIEAEVQNNQVLIDEQEQNYSDIEDEKKDKPNSNMNFDAQIEDDNEGGWGDDEDVDLPPEPQPTTQQAQKQESDGSGNKYRRQENALARAGRISQLVGEQTAVGSFEIAFQTMKKQLGIVNFEPFKNIAMKIKSYSQTCVPNIPFLQSQMKLIEGESGKPFVFMNLNQLSFMVQQKAYKLFGKGPSKFQECIQEFQEVLLSIPFIQIKNQEELEIIKGLIRICVNYIMAIKCHLKAQAEPHRALELTTYMALCNLQLPHRERTLTLAQTQLFKEKNFIYCSYFAKKLIRLLENSSNKQETLNKSKRILAECEKQGSNNGKVNIEEGWLYDDDIVYQIDAESLTVIDGGAVKCPYCGCRYHKHKEGEICPHCQVAKIGQDVLGLRVQA